MVDAVIDTALAKIAGITEASDWGKMTPEERQADVDTLVEDAQVAQRGEPEMPKTPKKPEPEPEPEQNETNETTDAGDEIPADADAVEEDEPHDSDESPDEGRSPDEGKVKEEPKADDWLDGETRELASTMGLTDEDLGSLSSREEFDRVLKIIDRNAMAVGKAALEKTPADRGLTGTALGTSAEREPEKEPEKPAADSDTRKDAVLDDLARFKLGEEFDEGVAKPINDFVEAASTEIRNLRTDLAGLVQQQQQVATDNIHRHAVESLHSLGHKDLFGEPGKPPTKEQTANIDKAIDAHLVHAAGLFAMGRQASPTPEFLKAAVRMEFGDQISKQEQRRRVDKLRKQSARRTGGASSKTTAASKPEQGTLESVKSDPDIDNLFNALVSEQSG